MAGERYNELIITFTDNGEQGVPLEADITADNIVEESMKLTQSINDENYLKFGGCIAAQFSIDLLNTDSRKFTDSLVGRWISVKLIEHTDSGNPLLPSSELTPGATLYPGNVFNSNVHYLFSGKIESATLDKNDLNVRNIVAYDAMAILHATDATNYVYREVNNSSGVFNISIALNYCLALNGKTTIPRYEGDNWQTEILNEKYQQGTEDRPSSYTNVQNHTIKNSYWAANTQTITCGELLKCLCEDLAVFGIIVPNSAKGAFKMITLKGTPIVYQYYEKLQSEEYISTGYTDYLFLTQGNSSGKTGSALSGFPMATDEAVEKSYDFTKNVTIYEPSAASGQSRTSTPFDRLIMTTSIGYRIAMNSATDPDPSADINNYLPACQFDSYRPLTATVEGIPEQIVGKPITIIANKTNPDGSYVEEGGEFVKEYINSYVFKRTLTGIQALTDEIEVKGQR